MYTAGWDLGYNTCGNRNGFRRRQEIIIACTMHNEEKHVDVFKACSGFEKEVHLLVFKKNLCQSCLSWRGVYVVEEQIEEVAICWVAILWRDKACRRHHPIFFLKRFQPGATISSAASVLKVFLNWPLSELKLYCEVKCQNVIKRTWMSEWSRKNLNVGIRVRSEGAIEAWKRPSL